MLQQCHAKNMYTELLMCYLQINMVRCLVLVIMSSTVGCESTSSAKISKFNNIFQKKHEGVCGHDRKVKI